MRFPAQSRMSVTRRGEKEQRLTAFIARGLPTTVPGTSPFQDRTISVLARSIDSPVVRAIGALAQDIAAAGASVRLLLTRSDRVADRLLAEGGCSYPQISTLDCEVRVTRDPRLIEAHEQMVLGERACWTGDSMRRDPAAGDAYESFVDDGADLARAARSTFERLWATAEPLIAHGPMASLDAAPGLERRT
jgi:hypothetical protein